MTTIAWDGRTLAADRQMTDGTLALPVTKIKRVGKVLVAIAGALDRADILFSWVENGRWEDQWPTCQEDSEAELLVIEATGTIAVYDRQPRPIVVEHPFYALGSGRDFAISAMHMGASAKKAVEIASIYDTGTGLGVDILKLKRGRDGA